MKRLLYLLLLLPCMAFSQIQVIEFNADWNAKNGVEWIEELTDCKTKRIDIMTDMDIASKYEIVVCPTIVIYNNGEEVKRFQADISFSMKATKDDVQAVVDEIIMDEF
jgi:hypothetical protein